MPRRQLRDHAVGFEGLGLHPKPLSALSNLGFREPMPIQTVAIARIVVLEHVIIRAKKGSGKTLSYVISVINRCIIELCCPNRSAPTVLVIVPTPDSCQKVSRLFMSLCELGSIDNLKIAMLTSTTLSEIPDIVVSTPGYLRQSGFLEDKDRLGSLGYLILDDVDKLLLDGDEDFLKSLVGNVSEGCQCIVVSDDPSSDLRKLKTLVRRTPYIVTLPEEGPLEFGITPYNVKQRYVSCDANDKLLYIFSLLVFAGIRKTSLIFTNSFEMCKKLSRNLEPLEVKMAVLSDKLCEGDRMKIIEQLRTRDLDLIIVDDESCNHPLRGIELNDVYSVVHYEMPLSVSRYVERIDHTGRATGFSIALVSPEDMKIWEDIKASSGDESKFIAPYARIQWGMTRRRRVKYFRHIVEKAKEGVKCIRRIESGGYTFVSLSDSDSDSDY